MLAAIRNNWAAREPDDQRRVILVAIASADHNGAFIRDEALKTLVLCPTLRTIVLEGVPSLRRLADLIEEVGDLFGEISAIMFSGHGASRGMQAAGDGAHPEPIDLDNNTEETVHLLQTAIGRLTKDGRLMFNACMTAQASVDPTPVGTMDREAFRAQRSARPTLAEWARGHAGPGRDVMAPSASVRRPRYLDDNNEVRLTYPSDPAAAFGDHATYAREGLDPIGVVAALIALCADDPGLVEVITEQRRQVRDPSWNACVIAAFCDLIWVRSQYNLRAFASLAELVPIIAGLHVRIDRPIGTPALSADHWRILRRNLLASTEAKTWPHVQIALAQISLLLGVEDGCPMLLNACARYHKEEPLSAILNLPALHEAGVLGQILAAKDAKSWLLDTLITRFLASLPMPPLED
ncbi:MAG TPA: hypothetical protein VGM88_18115 [Kofleriaceae bacterium]